MLRSLRDFNPRDDLEVFIVHQRLDSDERAKLVGYLSSFLPSVSFLQVDHALLEGFPESAHVKLAAYYRLLFRKSFRARSIASFISIAIC